MLRIKLSMLLLLFSVALIAQKKETDFGSVFSIELRKSFGQRFSATLEEELRLKTNNNYGFDRWSNTIGLDYTIISRKLKTGIYYSHLYTYNSNNYYEHRHRYYLNLNYKETFDRYTLSWRGRVQGTYRDERKGEYRINPKYVLRNKIEIEYSPRGLPWTPYFSVEMTNTLNDPLGNVIERLRFQAGTTWRLDRTNYLDFFFRWNEYLVNPDPRVLSIGIGYKTNL